MTRAEAAEQYVTRVRELEAALAAIQQLQPRRVEWFREKGVVFDSAPGGDDRWQEIAFQVYTDLCEAESIANATLGWPVPKEENRW